jgi:N-acetylmuramoyl-L-alanine amidase
MKDRQSNRMMLSRSFVFWGSLLFVCGCLYDHEPVPEIIHSPTISEPVSVQPESVRPRPTRRTLDEDIPRDWLPPSRFEKRWQAIVVHHSGTQNGNAAIFDKWHREGNDWEGVGYDFVIGNGTDSGDGQVEVTFRWREQRIGAHCGGTPGNWANEEAVGICLVGNFNHTAPTTRQMQSLVKLVRFIQKRYGIPKSRIYGHNTTPGARATDCPGKRFSMTRLKSMLDV